MLDFFDTANGSQDNTSKCSDLFNSIYGWYPNTNVFLGINLQWPNFDLPKSADKYFISFHTEQINDDWVLEQAQKVYPKPIMLVSDSKTFQNAQCPDNIIYVRWITWHQQLKLAIDLYGICLEPELPEYQFSSLSFRHSQFKKFVTAWLLKNVNQNKLILTWHGHITSQHHVQGYPDWATWLDNYNFEPEPSTFINWNDNFGRLKNTPLYNTNWNLPPYTDALVNLTNETFNYSLSVKNGQNYVYPGPYLTEKTYKPLLAGRPFVAIGQYQTLSTLKELGFNIDFGWTKDYDDDAGDLTRIQKIFNTLEEINSQSIEQLYECSLIAVKHNVNHIVSENLKEVCCSLNQKNQKQIVDFLC